MEVQEQKVANKEQSKIEPKGTPAEVRPPIIEWVSKKVITEALMHPVKLSFSIMVIFFTLLFCLLVFLKVAPSYLNQFIKSGGSLKIATKDITFAVEKGKSYCLTAVTASETWQKSGVIMEPHQKVRIEAIGRTHCSIKRLLEAVNKYHKPPMYLWSGPEGIEWSSEGSTWEGRMRESFLLNNKAKMGTLLAYLTPKNGVPPHIEDSIKVDDLMIYKDGIEITNNSDEEKMIWFIINDIALKKSRPEESKSAYIGGVPHNYTDSENVYWNSIINDKLWNIFYLDNIGAYEVKIENLDQD